MLLFFALLLVDLILAVSAGLLYLLNTEHRPIVDAAAVGLGSTVCLEILALARSGHAGKRLPTLAKAGMLGASFGAALSGDAFGLAALFFGLLLSQIVVGVVGARRIAVHVSPVLTFAVESAVSFNEPL